jgi:DUF1365 family protein
VPGGIRPNLAAWLASHGKTLADADTVRLLTFPTCFGYGFNPVSFYYITPADGAPVYAVAEVVNTFREMKLYLVEPGPDGAPAARVPKNFYVSPFSALDLEFDFRFDLPDHTLRVQIDDYSNGEKTLVSSLTGKSLPLTAWNLASLSLTYPLVTLKVILLIHWEALRLWMKKIPFRMKEADPRLQQGAFRAKE